MKKFSRRLLTVVLACAMVFGLSGMTAFATEVGEQDAAAEPDTISEAEGAAEDAAAEETVAEDEVTPLAGTATYTPDYTWYTGQGAGTYTISSAEQLAALSEIVNGTADGINQYSFRGQTVELNEKIDCIDMNEKAPVSWSCVYPDDENYNGVADIKVSTSEGTCAFTPIGNMRFDSNGNKISGNAFEGTFEGNGVTIKNLYVTGDEGYLGLFGVVGPADATKEDCDATVRNFTLSGVVECTGGSSSAQMDFVGGAVGKLNAGGTVEYVTNESLLVDAPGTDNVGGIVGFAGTPTAMGYDSNPSVSNTQVLCCENNAPVRAYYKVGGIVGENAATVKYCCNKDEGWIMCRRNTGQGAGVGGIVGRNGNNNTADEEALVAFCYNTGIITNNGRNDDSASNTIRGFAGVCGTTYGANGKVETHNCYNIAAIPVGYGQYNSITNYIEGGAVVAVRDNYSLDDEDLIHHAGDSVQENGYPVSETDFKVTSRNSGDILYDLGAYFVADTTGKINGGYPILFWEDEQEEPKITDLEITKQPNKLTYNDEVFDPTGMVVTATYSNGAEMEIQPVYATDGTNTYTLSDCYTYDNETKLKTDDEKVTISFGGKDAYVYINGKKPNDYIPVITSTGKEYQLSYSDIDEALEAATETTITDGNRDEHIGKFVLVKDLLQTYLGISESEYEKFSVSNAEGQSVTVPGEYYTNDENLYLYYNGTCYCLAGEDVSFDKWYENVSEIYVTLHEWGDVVWEWSEDYTSATASRTCSVCNKEDPASVDVTMEVIEPGERTAGKTTYTATATFADGTVVTDTKDKDFQAAFGHIDVAIYRVGEEPEKSELLYSAINEAMCETELQTFTYITGTGIEPTTVTDRFVSIAKLLNITDTIDGACCYHVTSDVGGEYDIYLPTSACMYCRADTLIYRTAVDGSRGNMWVNSPTSIEVNYQHDWGDLVWNWSDDYSSATVTGSCQMDVCDHEEPNVEAEIKEETDGNQTTYTATATFSDGTVVTDTRIV